MALNIGDKIPEILGVNQDGNLVKAADYAGRKFVLYFYPKDSTPGCTAEACSFRDSFHSLKKAGYEILGVSVDSEASHRKFIEKQQLPFPLIADNEKTLVTLFGVWAEKTIAGRKYMGTLRTTFLINETGTIEKIIGPKEIKTKDHAEQILELIK
ncbi:MAG: thioredoxin-dependent thiol peroxidase [Prevotella sp.]|jgi:peroxiredoxin Q/BCP|nr:thioredoxin-dependent thiol peroxidase [Prevotella sp.]